MLKGKPQTKILVKNISNRLIVVRVKKKYINIINNIFTIFKKDCYYEKRLLFS